MTSDSHRSLIPILYNAGSYGTFVEWCLYYFSDETPDETPNTSMLPFTATGSSHNFDKEMITGGMVEWNKFILSEHFHRLRTIRMHPKFHCDENVVDNIYTILSSVNKIVVLYPTDNTIIWNINNKFDKVYSSLGWLNKRQEHVIKALINWNQGATNIEEFKIWQLREFLSYYLLKQHTSESMFDLLKNFQHPSVLKIPIEFLRDNFEVTIKTIMMFCGFDVRRENFQEVYSQWMPLQVHNDKDALVNTIVDSVVNDWQYSWESKQLSLVDEAFVQMKLRDLHNLELKCYNLDVFPTNTNDLKNLLIPK